MTSLARQQRAALQSVLESVPEIGSVHNRARLVTDWNQYLDLFRVEIGGRKVIRGWQITRSGITAPVQFPQLFAFGTLARPYVWSLTGIAGLEDARETALDFEDLVEAVMDAVDDEQTLVPGGIVGGVGPCVLQAYDERSFASTLCHYAEILVPSAVPRSVP